MLGYASPDEDHDYLMSGGPRKGYSKATLATLAMLLVSAGSVLTLASQHVARSPRYAQYEYATWTVLSMASDEESGDVACTTKAYAQCGGMNFTEAKHPSYQYNTTAEPFACCPPGTSCVAFGPVWAMCMPTWSTPTAPPS